MSELKLNLYKQKLKDLKDNNTTEAIQKINKTTLLIKNVKKTICQKITSPATV